MGHKINPFSYRLGITKDWKSKWFPKGNMIFKNELEEDCAIRKIINKKLKPSGIVDIDIERRLNNIYDIVVYVARPGLAIGKGGKGIEEAKRLLKKCLDKIFKERNIKNFKYELNINIEEIKNPETSAKYVAQLIAWDLEKRMPYRRTIKGYLEKIMQHREVKGAKIKVSGRLDGAEIHRKDQVSKGRMPLNTLRSKIDYGEATAFASYGTIGIKTWIYFGDILEVAS